MAVNEPLSTRWSVSGSANIQSVHTLAGHLQDSPRGDFLKAYLFVWGSYHNPFYFLTASYLL